MEEPKLEEIPADIFDNPVVIAAGYAEHAEEIRNACNAIFGRLLTPEEFFELISAPNQSELTIEARRFDMTVELRLHYRLFNGTHDYTLYIDENTGKRVIEFENIANQNSAPDGLETLLFAHQVRSFRKYEIEEIRLFAEGYAGHPSRNGYYVWARFGFLMVLDGYAPRLAAAGFQPAETTLELFARENGPDWWNNNGSERNGIFYLGEESKCSLALQAYLESKGIRINGGRNDPEN